MGLPAGIGLATLRSILKLWLFVPGRWRGVYSAGNGPAMRSALLGVCFAADEARIAALIERVGAAGLKLVYVTHPVTTGVTGQA